MPKFILRKKNSNKNQTKQTKKLSTDTFSNMMKYHILDNMKRLKDYSLTQLDVLQLYSPTEIWVCNIVLIIASAIIAGQGEMVLS